MRITTKDLEAVCRRINHLMETPEEPYKMVDGKMQPQANCYHLDGAYGGYALHQMSSTVGCTGVHDVFGGHYPKAELYSKMQAFIEGIYSASEVKK